MWAHTWSPRYPTLVLRPYTQWWTSPSPWSFQENKPKSLCWNIQLLCRIISSPNQGCVSELHICTGTKIPTPSRPNKQRDLAPLPLFSLSLCFYVFMLTFLIATGYLPTLRGRAFILQNRSNHVTICYCYFKSIPLIFYYVHINFLFSGKDVQQRYTRAPS